MLSERAGQGLDHASPALLELLKQAEANLLNHRLLQEDHVAAGSTAAVEPEAAPSTDAPAKSDTAKTSKAAKAIKAKGAKNQTAVSAEKVSSTTAPSPSPSDVANAAVPGPSEPADPDKFDQQIALVKAKVWLCFLCGSVSRAVYKGTWLTSSRVG